MRRALLLGLVFAASGCQAGIAQRGPVATASLMCRLPRTEALCTHCNCLMPAGIDPNAMCPVCNCGKKAHECVR